MNQKKICEQLLEIERVIPILNKITLFGGLNDKQLYAVFRLLKRVCYKAEEYVFKQGDQPSHIYIILCGKVKIVVDVEGTPLEMIELHEGQCFGDTAVLAVQLHSASAITVEDTELIVLSREALLSTFDSDKDLFGMLILNLAREASRRLHNTDEVLLHYISHERGAKK
jgi:CRP/FNR family cyclic AMP-dependent transcriptional regulator